jgi:hypothetical protein
VGRCAMWMWRGVGSRSMNEWGLCYEY